MAAPAIPRQLVLSWGHDESHAPEDFIRGAPNAAALGLIERWPDWPARTVVIAGPEGSGKSHLASIWAARSGARIVAGEALADAVLPETLSSGALVIDDLAPRNFDARALFHLLNMAREQNGDVLIAARSAPSTWPVGIPDLASRLRALPVVPVAAPDERLLRALLIKLAADRQIELDETVVNYLLIRVERSFAGIRAAIHALDQEAMRQKRPVTRALAAEVLRDASF